MTTRIQHGTDVLHNPKINRSTGYTEAERKALGLVGLVPDVTESIETQLSRVLLQLEEKATDLDRFIYLMNLLDTNETLFYRTLMSDPARFFDIVYDPTIAEACLKFDHILRRPRGMYLSITRRGHVKEVLRNWPVKDVRFICVTNSSRQAAALYCSGGRSSGGFAADVLGRRNQQRNLSPGSPLRRIAAASSLL